MSLKIINELIETRINGNSIKGNITYEAMLKRVRKKEIRHYVLHFDLKEVSGTKLEMIEQIARNILNKRV